MYRALKLRLYPNKEQEQTLNKVLGCYRVVYNNMLDLKKNAYDKDKNAAVNILAEGKRLLMKQ